MTTSAVKARVHAFETMQASTATIVGSRSPQDLLETPISPTATSITPIVPSTSSPPLKCTPPSPSPSPPNLGRKTSLIDLKDWVVDDGPLPYLPRQKPPVARKPPPLVTKPSKRHVSDSVVNKIPPPLISLDSPPKTRAAPPLPPRQASYSSLQSISSSNTSASSLSRNSNPPARSSSDSLTVDHTYPPLSKLGINIPSRHGHASSVSSFHSVSLSSDGGTDPTTPGTASSFSHHIATFPIDHADHDPDQGSIREPDAVSLDESFENLSMTSAVSPSISSVSYDWEVYPKRAPEPPKLPLRPVKPPTSAPTSPHRSPLLVPKRDGPPPPPPPRPTSSRNSLASTSAASASDRSSILSVATSRTSISSATTPKPKSAQLTRPTPVPPAARRRYEAVFAANAIATRQVHRAKSPPPRKPRQAAGWRGLSVDLITNPEEIASNVGAAMMRPEPIDEEVGVDERLDGETVRAVWKLSRLTNETLRVIWSECDLAGAGSLDRDGFVKGMWRIDEELRRAQMHKHLPPRLRVRPSKPMHAPKPILR